MYKITEAYAEHTGGNIWLFYGTLANGNHYLVTDDGFVMIHAEDIYSKANCSSDVFDEWLFNHNVEELNEEDRKEFCDNLCDVLLKTDFENRGFISDEEIIGYKEYFKA